MKQKQVIATVTCRKCGYTWRPRRDDPNGIRKCPNQECQAWMPLKKGK